METLNEDVPRKTRKINYITNGRMEVSTDLYSCFGLTTDAMGCI